MPVQPGVWPSNKICVCNLNNLDANDADRREAIMLYMLHRRRSRVFYNHVVHASQTAQ